MIYHGDSLDILKTLEDNSVDSLVTDPPAGISFMNKAFDHHRGGREQWIAWLSSIMREAHRVMKPGAHGLVWALPRTAHWTATALEDAGFEIRDKVYHAFGSGFPKSLDVSKAIDKQLGATREVIGKGQYANRGRRTDNGVYQQSTTSSQEVETLPASDQAKQHEGKGTALKPAMEEWILIRKPLSEKSVAANVLRWGTGALNIDDSRIEGTWNKTTTGHDMRGGQYGATIVKKLETLPQHSHKKGRFPSHFLLSHTIFCDPDGQCDERCPVRMLDQQSGILTSGRVDHFTGNVEKNDVYAKHIRSKDSSYEQSRGTASRFFQQFYYAAKASRSERNKDCSEGNNHPTVKNQKLMEYLVQLITPQGGTVLDCFAGSGATGVACATTGHPVILIEKEAEYVEIIKARMKEDC